MARPLVISLVMIAFWAGSNDAQEKPLKVCILFGQGKKELLNYQKYLEGNFNVKCQVIEASQSKQDKATKKHIPGPFQNIEALADCDVILSNLYRTWAPDDQLDVLKKAYKSKPVVGLRKAHHGFQNWLDADKEVFGVKYRGHYFGKDVKIQIVDKHKDHPFFKGFTPFLPGGGLYQHTELAPDVEVLMVGNPVGKDPAPQMWQRIVKERGNQRVVYTRYDPGDLQKSESARDMLTRALFWCADREMANRLLKKGGLDISAP